MIVYWEAAMICVCLSACNSFWPAGTASKSRHRVVVLPRFHIHLWTWLSWRGKNKLLNEHPLEHCVKQWALIGRFPSFPLQRGLTACLACQRAVAVPVPLQIPCSQVWGSNLSQGNFLWCDSNDNSYESIDKIIQKIFSTDRPLQKVKRRKKAEKIILTEIRTPDLETWN